MSKKSFMEKMNDIVAGLPKQKSGAFSKQMFDTVAEAMINDPDYEFETVKVKNGRGKVTKTYPVRELRRTLLTPIFKDIGHMDDADIKVALEEYQFSPKQVEGLYAFNDALIQEYMKAGKHYRLQPTRKFNCSLMFIPGESNTGKKYVALRKKSPCPRWLQEDTLDEE